MYEIEIRSSTKIFSSRQQQQPSKNGVQFKSFLLPPPDLSFTATDVGGYHRFGSVILGTM
jgi:hypothetical protein